MLRTDFDYELPAELIARYPAERRTDSRLLCLSRDTGALQHKHFNQLPSLLREHDLLVFNNSKVIPARLYATKPTGGRVEILIERVLSPARVLVQLRASKTPQLDSELILSNGERVSVCGRHQDLFELSFQQQTVLATLDAVGHVPLPPYLQREDEAFDRERYQTVYAEAPGSVAAPTAGLHFDTALMQALAAQAVFVTLHIGAGTFQPVRADKVSEHTMHAEYIDVSAEVCARVRSCQQAGGRVIAVGTTSVRCLETAAASGGIEPYQGDTDIFIYPGYQFNCVDAMITNFHLPQSSLLMLVSAFAGYQHTMATYQAAVQLGYRFYSYGDAMWVSDEI